MELMLGLGYVKNVMIMYMVLERTGKHEVGNQGRREGTQSKLSPVVNDNMVTAADLISYECPKCGGRFKDFTKYQCDDCERKFWNEITLDKTWFPKKLSDGSPDWNSVKKDKPQFGTEWSYGRLNIKTMEMERVLIDRDGKWDYLTDFSVQQAEKSAIKDADAYSATLREIENNRAKSAKEVRQEVKHKQKMENAFIRIEKRDADTE